MSIRSALTIKLPTGSNLTPTPAGKNKQCKHSGSRGRLDAWYSERILCASRATHSSSGNGFAHGIPRAAVCASRAKVKGVARLATKVTFERSQSCDNGALAAKVSFERAKVGKTARLATKVSFERTQGG